MYAIRSYYDSGMGREDAPGDDENSTMAVAVNVPGFDVIFCGHDHREEIRKVVNVAGDSVLVIDGGSRAFTLMNASVTRITSYNVCYTKLLRFEYPCSTGLRIYGMSE